MTSSDVSYLPMQMPLFSICISDAAKRFRRLPLQIFESSGRFLLTIL